MSYEGPSQGQGDVLNPNDIGYDVILIAGQSNNQHWANGYDSRLDYSDSRIERWEGISGQAYYNQRSYAIEPNQTVNTDGPVAGRTGVSNGLAFARWYAQRLPANRKVLLVYCSVGSTAVVGSRWAAPSGDLYVNAIARANAAIAANSNNRLAAILWVQGESDAGNQVNSQTYITALDSVIDGFRSSITGAANVPFLIGSMTAEWRADPTGNPFNTTVAAANEIHTAHVTAPFRRPYVAFVTGPTGLVNDLVTFERVHYNAAGQRELGRRFALTAYPAALLNTPSSIIIPSIPTNFTAVPLSGTSVQVQWDAVNNAGSYTLEYRQQNVGSFVAVNTGAVTTRTISGLTNGFTYEYRVRSNNYAGSSAFNTISQTQASVPTQVTGLTSGTITSTSIALSWNAASNTPTDYIVQYKQTSSGTFLTFSDGVSTNTNTVVTGLTPNTSYDFRVSATNANGTGPVSTTLTVSTAVNAPGQVINLATGTPTATTVPLTWSAPLSGGTPTDYIVEYKETSSGTFLTFSDGVSTNLNATVTGLTSNTSYDFRVTATNSGGNGTPSSTVTITTDVISSPPGQVTGLATSSIGSTSIGLTWNTASNNPTDYIVEYKETSSGTFLTFSDGVSTTTSTTVTGLTINTSYDFRITATNAAGNGTPSSTLTASTASVATLSNTTFGTPTWGGSPRLSINWTLTGGSSSSVTITYRAGGTSDAYQSITPVSSDSNGALIALNPTSAWDVRITGANTIDISWVALSQPFALLDFNNATVDGSNNATSIPSLGTNTTAWTAPAGTAPVRTTINSRFAMNTTINRFSTGPALPLGSYSIVVLVRHNNFTGWGNYVTSSSGVSGNIHAFWRSGFDIANSPLVYGGHATPYRGAGPAGTQPGNTNLIASTWYALAITYNPTGGTNNMKLYVNGTLAAQATVTERGATETGMNFNAYLNTAASGNDGTYGGVAIYSGVELTQSQVTQLGNSFVSNLQVTL